MVFDCFKRFKYIFSGLKHVFHGFSIGCSQFWVAFVHETSHPTEVDFKDWMFTLG